MVRRVFSLGDCATLLALLAVLVWRASLAVLAPAADSLEWALVPVCPPSEVLN